MVHNVLASYIFPSYLGLSLTVCTGRMALLRTPGPFRVFQKLAFLWSKGKTMPFSGTQHFQGVKGTRPLITSSFNVWIHGTALTGDTLPGKRAGLESVKGSLLPSMP